MWSNIITMTKKSQRLEPEKVKTNLPRVLVLNADYSPLHHVSVQKAITMQKRGVATVELAHPTETFGKMSFPIEIILNRYVDMGWLYKKPLAWSKRGVMLRDKRKCAYCGNRADTIDHVHPQCLGGKSTWENTVACCFKCNNKKDHKSLAEMGWTLKTLPKTPHRTELMANRIQLAESGLFR